MSFEEELGQVAVHDVLVMIEALHMPLGIAKSQLAPALRGKRMSVPMSIVRPFSTVGRCR